MNQRAVLVTGASTGIGNACAHRFARAGWKVYGSVRRQEDAERIARESGDLITPIIFDITDASAVESAVRRIDQECGGRGLNGIVNNAGIAVAGPLEFLPIEELRRQLEVNVISHVAITQALLPSLRRGRGRIAFIGSIAGRSALPFMGPYCASKFALEAIADAWRIELKPFNMHVAIIEPGVIATPIWDTATRTGDANIARMPAEAGTYYGKALAGLRKRITSGMGGRPPEAVAEAVEHALTSRRPRARYLIGGDARMRLALQNLPTRVRDRLIVAAVRRL